MANPIESPTLFDYILLSGVRSPGLATLDSGGERKQKWESQQSPLTAGAIVIFKGEEVSSLTYTFTLWTPGHFLAFDAFSSMLRAGAKQRPPRVYDLVDPAVVHCEIKAVALASIGPIKKVSPGKWTFSIELQEYRKPKPSGGPIKPAEDIKEDVLQTKNDEVDALAPQVAAAEATGEEDE